MYLLANLAVGGTWPGAPDASTPFPATFEIDYIRAYAPSTANSGVSKAKQQDKGNDK
jgi:beta-glucanase (GH16 family)